MGDLDLDFTPGERAIGRLIREAHLTPADRLGDVVAAAAAELGARETEVFVVDQEQRVLVPMRAGDPVPIDGTLAGRAFRLVEAQVADLDGGGRRLWLPLLDGLERLGVIGLAFDALDETLLARCRRLAGVVADMMLSRAAIGDTLHRLSRRREMSLASEMQWALMPPLTAGTPDLALAAALEPSYEVGGDLVDYAFDGHCAHVAVFDAMGHGLQASLTTSIAVGAYRNRRRAGDGLEAMAMAMEQAIRAQFGGAQFVTGIIATLDTATGRFEWVNAGHPPALLLRGGRIVKELAGASGVPLGVGINEGFERRSESLQPGDRLLLYTDGVVEARTPEGEEFGLARLADFVVRADASHEPIAETMRRLSHAVLDHQRGALRDDATQLLVEWRTGAGPEMTERYWRSVRV